MGLVLSGPSGPPDAKPLSDDEAKFYIDNLQGRSNKIALLFKYFVSQILFAGLWEIVLTDAPGFSSFFNNPSSVIGAYRANFSRVHIMGNRATYSRPVRGKGAGAYTEVQLLFVFILLAHMAKSFPLFQTLLLHKSPDGTVYFDGKGTTVVGFSPEKGEVHLMHALGLAVMFKRDGGAVTGQPGFGQHHGCNAVVPFHHGPPL